VDVIEISARRQALEVWSSTASLELHLSGLTRANWKQATARPFTFVLGLFLFTALVTIVRLRRPIWNQLKYYLCISLALLFTISMVYLIGVTSLELSNASKDHPTPLGFAYVYFDSYVKDAPDDRPFQSGNRLRRAVLGAHAVGDRLGPLYDQARRRQCPQGLHL
jgi:hypothetical protein